MAGAAAASARVRRRARSGRALSRRAARDRTCIAAEVPLLFETGIESSFDYVVLITAPAEMRRRRLTAKLTDSEFERRLAQQMPEDEKIARSDFVFHNTGDRKALREFVGQTVAHDPRRRRRDREGGAGETGS